MSARGRVPLLAVAAALVVVLVGIAAWLLIAQDASRQIAGIGGPFTLTDSAGHAVSDRDLRGRYLLVYFGYTFCPDACPTTLAAIAGALDKLGKQADRVQPVFITVDPERDTPKVMGAYTAAFSPRILGLTGTPQQIAAVAREYRAYYASHRGDGTQAGYTVDHSSIIYLMAPDGHFIAPIAADGTAQEIATDIERHMGAG